MTSVVLAVPTIEARRYRLDDLDRIWRERTPPDVNLHILYSEAGSSWGDGLNDVWKRTRQDPPDVLVCGSDDMVPADDRWLSCALSWLDRGMFPVPRVSDPRFENYGSVEGPHVVVEDGAAADMSTFPILRGDWLSTVFPLPTEQHYFADNWISCALYLAGVKAVAVPSCRILHLHAQEGRGAGYGSENNRLYIDTVRYSRFLESRGIARETLPKALRGHMWEERYLAVGREMGA